VLEPLLTKFSQIWLTRLWRLLPILALVCFLGASGCQSLTGNPVDSRALAPSSTSSSAEGGTLGVVWQQVEGPQLIGGSCFSWRCAGVGDPALVRDRSGLIVWFTTMGIRPDSKGGFVADGPWIGRALGLDAPSLKLNFSPDSPVISVGADGTWDRYVETPTVLHDDKESRWILWYLGYAERGGPTSFVAPAIGQMHSLDAEGKNWQRSGVPIYRPIPGAWDGVLVTGPTVVRGPDGIWRLYYTGIGTKEGVGLLTSTDGISWKPYANNPVLEAQKAAWDEQILEQAVLYFRGQYWMWYSGYQNPLTKTTSIAIGLATSPDGIHWSRHPENPVLKPSTDGWNDISVLAPDVLVEPDGSLLMAAYGNSHKNQSSAGSIGFWRSR